MKKVNQTLIAFIVGFVLILIVLVLSFMVRCPTPTQYNILRIAISLAAGAFASIIPGLFQFRYKGLVSATGALGVFAFVFIYDPAQIVSTPCAIKAVVSGTIFINNKEARNVEVRINQIKESTVTDQFGAFQLDCNSEDLKGSFNFRIIYGASLDSSFQYSSNNWQGLTFKFNVDTGKIAVNPVQDNKSLGAIQAPIHIEKKQIQNYFIGQLPQSSVVSYGGDQYCQYYMRYTDIRLQIKLSQDRTTVELAKVSFKASETTAAGCPYQGVAPNTHIYDLNNASIVGNTIFIAFNPDHANNPLCSLTLTGTIENDRMIVKLESRRIDMPDPKLVYSIVMDMEAELSNAGL